PFHRAKRIRQRRAATGSDHRRRSPGAGFGRDARGDDRRRTRGAPPTVHEHERGRARQSDAGAHGRHVAGATRAHARTPAPVSGRPGRTPVRRVGPMPPVATDIAAKVIASLDNVTKHYTMGEEVVRALAGVSIEFQRGGFYAIMGASGSGKSTMLN